MFRQGEISLKPVFPNLKGRVGWDSGIKATASNASNGNASNAIPISDASNASSARSSIDSPSSLVCFQCPACNASELSSNKAFQLEDLDVTCKCKTCKVNRKSKDWRCGCRIPWHLCTIHQSNANNKIMKPPSSNPTLKRKATVGPFTLEQLQEIDTKRMRKCTRQPLPPAANLLSAKLRERFAYLL